MSTKKLFFSILKYIIGILFIILIVRYINIKNLSGIINPEYSYIFLAFFATLLAFFLDSVRWKILTDEISGRKICSIFNYFRIYIRCLSLGQFVSQSGGLLVLRPVLMKKKYKLSYRESYISLFIEKVADLYFILVFILIFLINFFIDKYLIPAMSIILPLSFLIYYRYAYIFERLGFLLLKKINKLRKKKTYLPDLSDVKRFDSFKMVGLLSLTRVFLYSLRFFLIAQALSLAIPYKYILLGMPVAQLSLIFAFTPGALGILEAGWAGVLGLFSFQKAVIGNFVLGFRFYWLIFSFVIYILSYISIPSKNRLKNKR